MFCDNLSFMGIYYLNGAYVREEEAKISVADLGVIRGYGIFDYLRTYQGKPFHLLDRLLRLKYSAAQIGLYLPESLQAIEAHVMRLLEENNYPESSIKIVVTGGVSKDQMMPEENSSLIILVYPFKPFPQELYEKGIYLSSSELFRPIPSAKTTHYISAIVAVQKAREKGAYDALYVNSKGEVLEATTSNFFAFKNGALITSASEEILFGITREVILKIVPCPIEIRAIFYDELKDMDESFVSSSNREVMPISRIDDFSFPVGPMTHLLMKHFKKYVREEKWEPLRIERYSTPV